MVELKKLRVGLDMDNQEALLATLQVRLVLVEQILAAQSQDPLICTLRVEVANDDRTYCSQVIVERQKPSGLLQPLPIPEWKWERLTMNFVFKLPRAQNEIVRLHGVLVSIGSDRDPRLTSRFWTKLNESFGTQLQFSTVFHPQTDGQSERTIQTLEGVVRFGKRGKLSPRYIGPNEIIERVGPVAYRLTLPADLSRLLDVIHISKFRRYISDPSHVLEEQPVELEADFTYGKQPVQILKWKCLAFREKGYMGTRVVDAEAVPSPLRVTGA
ncbi:hypothetical protein L3X38_005607 [Prunus dulcis]|uniref:Tf2-1-like SH3-like domain-containing protein n=1 Tax=Prunus dulcis TaxID=3755 RepID=A0AAD5F4D4_PRUDU|nr:hypothetical protein L3X38_005607 [Prunus dulcis]